LILWLPIALILASLGGALLFTANEAMDSATADMEQDTPQWVISFCRNFFFAIFGIVVAILLTSAYLLAKMSLGL